MSQPVAFAPSQFSSCPGQSFPFMSRPAPFARPLVALSACPVSVSKSLYFVRLNYYLVIISRKGDFLRWRTLIMKRLVTFEWLSYSLREKRLTRVYFIVKAWRATPSVHHTQTSRAKHHFTNSCISGE